MQIKTLNNDYPCNRKLFAAIFKKFFIFIPFNVQILILNLFGYPIKRKKKDTFIDQQIFSLCN